MRFFTYFLIYNRTLNPLLEKTLPEGMWRLSNKVGTLFMINNTMYRVSEERRRRGEGHSKYINYYLGKGLK